MFEPSEFFKRKKPPVKGGFWKKYILKSLHVPVYFEEYNQKKYKSAMQE